MHLSFSGRDSLEEEKLKKFSDDYKEFGNSIVVLEDGDNNKVFTSIWLESEDNYKKEYSTSGSGEVRDWFDELSAYSQVINTRPN